MRLAVLDLGTNTFHLLIADVTDDGSFNTIFKSKISVKLGEGFINRKLIGPAAFERGISTLIHYKKVLDRYRPEVVNAFATSAIRSAENGGEFIRVAKKKSGIKVRIISGKEEARLIYLGVRESLDLRNEPALIIDIGGGSTEFIIGNQQKIFARHSFNIGAARLLDKFHPSDPITSGEINKIRSHIRSEINPLKDSLRKYPVRKLVGSSGSFETFAEMIGHRYHGKSLIRGKTNYEFGLKEFDQLYRILIRSTTRQRSKMKGLIPMRIDMIVLAAICTKLVLEEFEMEEMFLAKYALKEGALLEAARKLSHP